jgi:hypothetical protein
VNPDLGKANHFPPKGKAKNRTIRLAETPARWPKKALSKAAGGS